MKNTPQLFYNSLAEDYHLIFQERERKVYTFQEWTWETHSNLYEMQHFTLQINNRK